MAPTNPAEQAKQSLDGTIKRFLLEQCTGGPRTEVSDVLVLVFEEERTNARTKS